MKTNKQATGSNSQDRALSRRGFLAKTVLIGAGLAFGPSPSASSADQPKEINKMKTRKLGKLEVSELGGGCMSISANYGPPADAKQGIEVIRAAHEKASRFSIPPRFTVPIPTKTSSGKHWGPFVTRSLSQPNLASTSRMAGSLIVNQSTSGKWWRTR